MPGKWGGAHRACPPRSANELGCQANGGGAPGASPLDPPMKDQYFHWTQHQTWTDMDMITTDDSQVFCGFCHS